MQKQDKLGAKKVPAQKNGPVMNTEVPDEMMQKGMLKSGDNVMLIGLGAGLTWGGVIYRLP